MNKVTLAIPHRWEEAIPRILRFFKNEDRLRAASIKQFEVAQTPPLDEGQIWVFESTLDTAQAIFCDAAVTAMNTALNAVTSDGWRATKDVTSQAQRDVEDIESIRAAVGRAGLSRRE